MNLLAKSDVDLLPNASACDVLGTCYHCHLPLTSQTKFEIDRKSFCCQGCLSVYRIIQESGLDKFYHLTVKEEVGRRLTDYNSTLNFTYFDVGSEKEKIFYLEGVHCLACLWLIESSKKCLPGVDTIRLNMSNSQATIRINEQGSFSSVARWLNQLGYYPHLLNNEKDGQTFSRKENYSMLKRIGVAGFSTGNIMWFAISIYGGAQGTFLQIFSWLSGLLYLPALLYSAQPFFKNAYYKFKARQISLDIPVAVTILLGSVVSYVNLALGSLHFYFDSLAAFIFLLLSARFFLKRIQQAHASTQNVQNLFEASECLKKIDNHFERVSTQAVHPGDIIQLVPGETLPFDVESIGSNVSVNTALLTGEPLPKLIKAGDRVLAGSVVMSGMLEGVVLVSLKDSQLGQILNSVEASWLESSGEVQFTDRLANWLLLCSFLICVILLGYFGLQGTWEKGLERAMAVLIVTCPCALGLGVPLAYIQGLKSLFRKKIVVKNGEVLKRISDIRNIYFDKTGTITRGTYSVIKVKGKLDAASASKIWALEAHSTHPIAFGLRKYLEESYPLNLNHTPDKVSEELGSGIRGSFKQESWAVLKSKDVDVDIEVFCNEEKIVGFCFDDPLKDESARVLNWFRKQKIKTFLLTGDHRGNAERMVSRLGFEFDELFADTLPAGKAETLAHTSHNLMVGDGYNDVVAFEKASVGVALGQKVDLQLKNADVFIPSGRLDDLVTLFQGAKGTQKILRRNIVFSALYNVLGILGAVLGFISPLTAAVLMPLSSVTVLLSTVLGKARH